IASLIARGTVFTNSFAVTHPSQPNYLALWSGSTQGTSDDACPAPGSPYQTENLGHACEAAGLTWRADSEDLPSAGSGACAVSAGSATCSSSGYARKHDPWTDFGNLNHSNERPYTDLAGDLAAGRLANLVFVVPNQCDDMHDCSVSVGDTWLKNNVPRMLSAM